MTDVVDRDDDGEPTTGSPLPSTGSPARLAACRIAGRPACDRRPAGRRPTEPRQPRPSQPHRHNRRRVVRGNRRTGRQACADRQATVLHATAGDAAHRAGVTRAGLLDQGGVPADHRHGPSEPTRRQLGQPAGVLRALLLRHRSALHRRTVEPRQVPLQVQLDREGLHGPAENPVRRDYRGAVHGVSGVDGAVPVRVDGAGQVLHRGVEAGVVADTSPRS